MAVNAIHARARDPQSGLIEGYASLFGVPDMARDLVEPGAFAASLARRGAGGIRMLWQHDSAQPIGVWLSVVEDRRGLFVRGRLNLALERARDIFALIGEGAVDGLSIGFRAEQARSATRASPRRLIAVDLWEISIVTFPMLPGARVRVTPAQKPAADALLAGAMRRAAEALHTPHH